MKRVDYYKTYYENLSPSNFKVEKVNDKIVISGIENHYPKGFDDKDVKQYKVKQSDIDKYEKGGGIGQYAPLYHYVKRDMIIPILWDNKLKGSFVKGDKEYGVSTTRNPYSRMKRHNHNDDRLVLDQNKLRRDGYKIVPFDYLSIAIGREDETNIKHYATKIDPSRNTMQGFGFEYEEVILGNIEPLEDYLLYIDISFDKEDKSDFKINKIKKDLHLWENIMDEYPNVKLRLYQWGKRPYVVSIEDLRKLVKEYEDKNPPIKIKRKKRILQNGGQVPMNVKRFDKEGKEIDRMTWDEVKKYEKSPHIHFNIINSRWIVKNHPNPNDYTQFWSQQKAEDFSKLKYDENKDAFYSRKKYEALTDYKQGGRIKPKKTDANFKQALQKWESSMSNKK